MSFKKIFYAVLITASMISYSCSTETVNQMNNIPVPVCGNGTVETGETCDDGNTVTERCAYGETACQVCNGSCNFAAGEISFCGDGVPDGSNGEGCDDSNTTAGDGCDADCKVETANPVCGNNIAEVGEGCDDGNTSTESCAYGETSCIVCDSNCSSAAGAVTGFCGDGTVNGTEACDDNNAITEACAYGETSCTACDASCNLTAGAVTGFCGDGAVNGTETCDDSNTITESCAYGETSCTVCDASCNLIAGAVTGFCGDGTVNGTETCDDNNVVTEACAYGETSCTVCDSTCNSTAGTVTGFCGDGAINGPETCDDNNAITEACAYGETSCTVCDSTCNLTAGVVTGYCGDGTVNGTEACDDNNAITEACAYGETSCTACDASCNLTAGAVTGYCGDGTVNGTETCDDSNTITESCAYGETSCTVCDTTCNLTVGAVTGFCGDGYANAADGEQCDTSGTDTALCNAGTCLASLCGDIYSNAAASEQCDTSGTDTNVCNAGTCQLSSCGDGYANAADSEECDDGNTLDTDACLNTCTVASCGDGYIYVGVEQCDNSGTDNAVCIGSTCQYSSCGDGYINAVANEQCDTNGTDTDVCNAGTCLTSLCGDGYPNAADGEQCDTSGTDTVSCNAGTCLTSLCGDGYLNTADGETCDSSGVINAVCIGTTCQLSSCGDGYINAAAGEACDDGNTLDTDACLNACVAASCGDGYIYAGVEQCDSSGAINAVCIGTTCELSSCGDGYVNAAAGEECDDNNAVTEECNYGDTSCTVCDSSCSSTVVAGSYCGDSVLDAGNGEECDDGGVQTSTCESDCTIRLYSIGGNVSGMKTGDTLSLLNGADSVNVTGNSAFTFSMSMPLDSSYNVTLLSEPINVECTVKNGSGTIDISNITNIEVSCESRIKYFAANDGFTGRELYKTDGTEAGTNLVKDIAQGRPNSDPGQFIEMNGITYFTTSDAVNGSELWRTDGTELGTYMVKDICTGSCESSPYSYVIMNGTLYFGASTNAEGTELWKSDGTEGGTVLVKNICDDSLGQCNGFYDYLTVVNNNLFFSGYTDANGYELWISDGTADGTVMVKNICDDSLGYCDGNPYNMTSANGNLFFTAYTDANGYELWKSDGTELGTVMVKNICDDSLGTCGGQPDYITVFNNKVFFSAYSDPNGIELWESDGTEGGTVMVKSIGSPAYITAVNNTLYFSASDANGTELWKSDGTADGTVLVKDIHPSGSSNLYGVGTDGVNKFVSMNNIIYFAAFDGSTWSMWHSDGTADGTIKVPDSPFSSYLGFKKNGLVYFVGYDPIHGKELWKTNGTSAALVKDINSAADRLPSNPMSFTAMGGYTYFIAWSSTTALNDTVGLYKTNGVDSTELVKSFTSMTNFNLAVMDGKLYFNACDSTNGCELWESDGTTTGTVITQDIESGSASSNPKNLFVFNSTLFFAAAPSATGLELYKYTTAGGVECVYEVYTGTTGVLNLHGFTALGTDVFYMAGSGMYKTNGTTAGTTRVQYGAGIDLAWSGAQADNARLIVMGGNFYFNWKKDTTYGEELWQYDSITQKAVFLKDIYTGANSSSPANFTLVGSAIYFSANDGTNGRELWKTDGTAGGTVLVKNINTNAGQDSLHTSYSHFTEYNGNLYFSAQESYESGYELWKSDGTAGGTVLVKEINYDLNYTGSYPWYFTVLGSNLYFFAGDKTALSNNYDAFNYLDYKLYSLDGTGANTISIKNIDNGASGAVVLNGQIYFSGDDGPYGQEPWVSDGTAAGTRMLMNINVRNYDSFGW
ncbi:MAG: hypothetical protein OEZ22_02385 [Spirochaetia bacterium]|nr:hypothetical protein [Spirochaetia bacterium]